MIFIVEENQKRIGQLEIVFKENTCNLIQDILGNSQHIIARLNDQFYSVSVIDDLITKDTVIRTNSKVFFNRRIIKRTINSKKTQQILHNKTSYYSKILPFILHKIDIHKPLIVFNNSYPDYFEVFVKKICNEKITINNRVWDCEKYIYSYSIAPSDKSIIWIHRSLGILQILQKNILFYFSN